jgi:nucleotide-binding universal stress UspA family protein
MPRCRCSPGLSIKVMTVRNDDCRVTPAAVVTYLARHGLEASAHEFDRPHVRAEVAVLDALYALGGDYLVMGAFGHGRLRERLFGGVTRQCLVESPVPLFLAA